MSQLNQPHLERADGLRDLVDHRPVHQLHPRGGPARHGPGHPVRVDVPARHGPGVREVGEKIILA